MTTTFYVRIRGHISGPFSEEKLGSLVKRGQLSRSHEISEDGQNWQPASELAHLFGKSKETEDGSEEPKGVDAGDGASAGAPPSTTPVNDKWYYSVGGQKLGPLQWETLQDRVVKGKIPRTALIWTEGMPDWQDAASIPGLSLPTTSGAPSPSVDLSWGELLPVFRVLNDGSWTLPWVQCLAIALLFPLLALEYQGKENLPLIWVAVIFLFYFTLLWTAFFHWCLSPSRISPWRLIGVWLLTATLGVLGVIIVGDIPLVLFLDALDETSSASLLKRLVGWTVAVGLIEECGKLIAVLILAKNLSTEKLPRTCAFMGVVSGLAFGTVEAVFYTFNYALQHEQSVDATDGAYGILLFSLMLRWICLPLLHAVWAGISGFFVGLSYKAPVKRWGWILRGLFIVAVLHGVYDVGASNTTYSWLTVLSAAASLSLFVGYLRSEDRLSSVVERCEIGASNS